MKTYKHTNTKRSTTLYCFSPPVMIATFVIEISLMAYTLWRYKLNPASRLVVFTLFLLAVFQLSEFNVCENILGSSNIFSRLGFIAITLLPPVGIHLIRVMSKRIPMWLVGSAYVTSLSFVVVFGLSPAAFADHVCTGNYVIFRLADGLGGMYFAYYYFWLLLGIALCMWYSITATAEKTRRALNYQALGYLSFVLPTAIANTLNPATIRGIPSVMCGFAILYALLLAFGIAPNLLKKR